MDGFSHPFRFVNQRPARLNTDSEAYKAQLVASALLTQIKELPITPDFGSTISPFSSMDMGNFIATVSSYIPAVALTKIEQKVNSDQTISLSIEFSMEEGS